MFNKGRAIHFQNISKNAKTAVHNFKVACDECCLDPSCMWSDCSRCKVASIHREKLAEFRRMNQEVVV